MTKVSPVSDLSAFLATLGRSGLLPDDELAKLGESLGASVDPKSAARELLKQNKITRWQAGQLLHGYHQLIYGKYKLLDQIGSGEMGRVYLAEHGQLGRRVALKALARKHTADPNILKAFLSDARRVGGLDHPNLCHMYDVNQEGDRYFLVMEYVEGQNLQQFVEKGGKPDLAKIIEIARQLAAGLAHAHAQKVLHGDLKPTNIVIDKTGRVKILDIGLSRLTEATAAANDVEDTTEAPSLASGIYRPQEQLDGKGIDERTDWYSLGGVLCYLLTGKPFHQPEACRSVEHLKGQRPDAPAELLALCASLLAENPVDRPASAADVTAALDKAEKSVGPSQPLPAAAAPAARPPLPRAKAEPAAAPAKTDSSAGKPRKPPVARPLADAPAASADTVEASAADTFSFNFSTSSAPPAKKPPVRKAVAQSPASDDSGTINLSGTVSKSGSKSGSGPKPADAGQSNAATAPKPKSKLPLILGGAIGGGVLLLALVAGLAFMFMGSGEEETIAKTNGAAESAVADAEGSDASEAGEASPEEANPVEANPVEANPVASTPAPEAPAEVANAPPASSDGSGSQPDDDAAPMPMEPPATEQPASPEPAEPAPDAAAPEPAAPAPMPEPKADPPKPEPPKPAPSKPAGNPFAGFAKAISLPKLPSGTSEPTSESLAVATLGPCNVDEKALIIVRLLGGETALKGGRQKFTLDAAENGTAERDWEIRCGTDNDSEVVALLSVKDQAITFQWTPEGATNASAPYLSNCMLEFNAGSGNHQCALRETVTAEPLVVELDKPNAGAKWNLDALPDERHMEVEVVSVQAGAPKSKIDNKTLTADKPISNVLLGPADDKMPLAIELRMSATAKQIEVKAVPKLKLEGLPPGRDRYTKKVVQTLVTTAAAAVQGAEQRHMVANQIKDKDQKKKALEQADIFKAEVAKANDQVQALQTTVQAVETSTIHFRVWYLADNGKVLLLDTGGPPPPAAKK